MHENLKPRDAAEVEQAVQWALADGKALEIVGHGSKRAIGRRRRMRCDARSVALFPG